MPRLRSLPLLVALLGTTACSLDVARPSRGELTLRAPTISARLDTTAWSDAASITTTEALTNRPGHYSIVADGRIADGRTVRLVMAMSNIRGAGTYPIGVGASVAGAAAEIFTSSGGVWSTPLSGAAGTLVLTEVTAARLRGTFTMSLAPQNSLAGAGPLNVTGGQFDLPVAGAGAGGVVPENAGSRLLATLDAQPFTAALVLGTHIGDDGLIVQGANDTRSILIHLEGVTEPGTYALTEATPRRFMSVTSSGSASREWNSRVTGSSGSVTITSMTPSRTTGTFTATLAPEPGTTGSLTIASGVFDVGRR